MMFPAPSWALGGLAIHTTDDPHLVDGVHYRLMTDPRLGLPIRPVHVERWDLGVDASNIPPQLPDTSRRHDATWSDDAGRTPILPIEVTPDNPITATLPVSFFSRCIWLKVDVEPGSDLRADIFRTSERGNRLLGGRDAEPLSLGVSHVNGVVVAGTGVITGITWLDAYRLGLDLDWVEVNTMGLPRDNRPRYLDPTPGPALLKALQRVHRGAPKRLGLHDEPDADDPGSTSTTTPLREDAKAAALGSMAADDLDALLDDLSAPQHALERSETLEEGISAGAEVPHATWKPVELIHTALHDPSMARTMGFMDVELPDDFEPDPDHVVLYLLRSWWALDPQVFAPAETWSFLPSLPGLVISDQTDVGGPAPDESPDGFPIFELGTLAVAVGHAPPRPPGAPIIDPEHPLTNPTTPDGLGPWLPADAPEARRQAVFDIRGIAPAGSLAVASVDGGVVTGMNERIAVVGQDEDRALLLVPSVPANAEEPGTGRLMHRAVPEDGLTIRIAQSDVFGRWSGWAERDLEEKARPLPPEPLIDLSYAMVDPDTAGPGAQWGELTAYVQVPPTESLAPGARLLDGIRLAGDVGGATFAIDVPASDADDGVIVVQIARPDTAYLQVGETVDATIRGSWFDTAGAESAESVPRVTACVDPRRPAVASVPPTLDWAAWPDVTGRSRVRLAWDAAASARFRVYVADEQRIEMQARRAIDGGDSTLQPLLDALAAALDRPSRAQALRDLHHLLHEDWFEGLTDEPIEAAASGDTVFLHEVSGSLNVLVGYKVVAETEAGVAADFATTPLWVWAVPDRRGPQRPMLEVVDTQPNAPRSVTLRLRLTGDPVHAIRYRLRRSTVHSDPRRMPVAATGDIVLDVDPVSGATDKYMTIVDDGALAHDRTGVPTRFQLDSWYSWVIEVQSPDLPGSSRPGAWSRPSPPVSTKLLGDPVDIDPPDIEPPGAPLPDGPRRGSGRRGRPGDGRPERRAG